MASTWIRSFFQRSKTARKRIQNVRRRKFASLRVENLEDRRLMAFTTPVTFPAGANPAGIAVGDFNGDGRDDMAVVSNGAVGTVGVLLSNADGAFAPKVDYAAGANAIDAAAGDLNGDGFLDLAIVGSAVDVLFGNGDGTFAFGGEYAAAASAHSIKVGDFNNDGRLDVGTMNTNSASVLLGNGDGSLQAPMTSPVAGNNINLVVGDYNRDGYLDMATSNTNSIGTINVLRGRGDGSFEPHSSYYAFSAPVYLATGDFNEDGYLDFACPNSYAATSMSVLLNNGDGTYGAPHTYGIAQTGYEIEVEDFNNDGHDDFAVRGGSKYMVSMGKGDGTFYPSVQFPTPAGRFEAGTHGDFNGDGAIDLAYPSSSGVTVLANDNADYQNLAGAVTFRLNAPATTTSGSVLPMTISAIDADGNVATGFLGMVYISSSDLAASTASGYAFNPADAGIPYLFTSADAGIHAFTGAIRLVTEGEQTVRVSAPHMTTASVAVNVTGQVRQLRLGAPTTAIAGDTVDVTVTAVDSTGAAAPGYSSKIHFSSTDSLAGLPADYTFTPEDAGSHTFRVTLKSSGTRFIGASEVGGSLAGGVNVSVSAQVAASLSLAGGGGAIGVSRPISMVARDVYGNLATSYNGTVHFTSSDPAAILPADLAFVNGTASTSVKFLTVGTQTLTATDIADATITGTTTSSATPPIANSFAVSGYPSTIAGESHGFTVTVIDTIGQTASGFAGTVYFSSSDVQAGLPLSYTFTTADAGVHTFAATLKTAGIQSITVRDLSGALLGSQAGIHVAASDFASFQMTVPNGADSKGHVLVTAGEQISLKVRAVDAFGNSTSDYLGTVGITSTDVTASVPGAYTFSAADGGEHVFPVELRTATVRGEVWSFTATDLSVGTLQSSLSNFEVVNAQAAYFKVTMPTNPIAGEVFTSKVSAFDTFGNTAKNYFGTVHFATSSAIANLPSDYTFDSSDLGVHDFQLSLNTSGTHNLTAVDASNSHVTGSESATVTPNVLSGFTVTANRSSVAGDVLNVTIRATDAYGNTATGYRGTVTLSSSDTLAVVPASYAFSKNEEGVHTFQVTLKTVGEQTISVRDFDDMSLSGTSSLVSVQPSSVAGSFVVTSFPATEAGVSQSFDVRVLDIFGNPTTSYVGTVLFSSSDVQAGLPASYTFTAADAGQHTFTATLKTAGLQSITIRDASSATAVGSQSGIRVTASSASSLAVSGYPASVAGTAQSFVVTAKDAYGNTASGFTGAIQFSSSDLKSGLPESYSFVASDAGRRTFTATLKTAGLQSITVKNAASTMISTQTGINISPAAAFTFRVSAPTSVTQGSGFKILVTALDAFGNVATGYAGKIQVTTSDPKGGKTSYSFSSRDAGVATLNFSLSTVGLQTLQVVDLANSALSVRLSVNVTSKK
jgi:hypothetical protein